MGYHDKIPDATVDQWVELYATGMTLRQIASRFGNSQSTVSRNLCIRGVTRTISESQKLRTEYKRNEDSPFYKHGKQQGYRRHNTGKGRQLSHRVVASNLLGRPLTKDEQVHHVNGDRSDNTPSNLWVFPSCAAHTQYHRNQTIHPDTIKLEDCL